LDGLNRVLDDPAVRQLHLGLLPPAPPEKDPMYEHHIRGLELKLPYAGSQALTTSEKRELLLDADSIRRLRPETAARVPCARRATARCVCLSEGLAVKVTPAKSPEEVQAKS
jgi:hypothetical protein